LIAGHDLVRRQDDERARRHTERAHERRSVADVHPHGSPRLAGVARYTDGVPADKISVAVGHGACTPRTVFDFTAAAGGAQRITERYGGGGSPSPRFGEAGDPTSAATAPPPGRQ